MEDVALLIQVMVLGSVAGLFGSLLGIGGGVFLVPFFVLVVGLPFPEAAALGLVTVIATSSTVSAGNAGKGVFNFRLGIVLEMATALGGLCGGLTASLLSERALRVIFSTVASAIGVMVLLRAKRRNIITDPSIDPGRLGGRFLDSDTNQMVSYRVKRMPLALAASFFAGNISGLLGIGGGIVKVPILNACCGIPLRVAAATSSMMIGVTALSTAPIYYAKGLLIPHLAAAAVIGVLIGSAAGMKIGVRARARYLKVMMGFVLFVAAAVMAWGA
ncbi:MAG: sulfite exporter TauE/SafE family protein [Deltaproteobacteria bacterium]|nr:sulfite exporter TauE/SafE family protein [Deltaproteobacteria bacterium]